GGGGGAGGRDGPHRWPAVRALRDARARQRARPAPRRAHRRAPRDAPRHEPWRDRIAPERRRRRLTFETRAVPRYRDEGEVVVGRASFASLQSAVSVLAGPVSICGAVYSAVPHVKPAPGTLDLLAVVPSDAGAPAPAGRTMT